MNNSGNKKMNSTEEVNLPSLAPQAPSQVEKIAQEYANKPKQKSYIDIFYEHTPYTPPTPEELERERKRQKSSAIISAVGDGISALSNLYHTTNYAPNVEQSGLQLSARNKARYDKLQQERASSREAWYKGYERALALDREQDDKERNWRTSLAQHADARADKERQAQHEDAWRRTGFLEKKRLDDRNYDLNHEQLQEAKRHNRANEGQARERLSLTRLGLHGRGQSPKERVGDIVEIPFSDGTRVSLDRKINRGAISALWQHLPNEVRAAHYNNIDLGDKTKEIPVNIMLDAIASHAYENTEYQSKMLKMLGAPKNQVEAHLRNRELVTGKNRMNKVEW